MDKIQDGSMAWGDEWLLKKKTEQRCFHKDFLDNMTEFERKNHNGITSISCPCPRCSPFSL